MMMVSFSTRSYCPHRPGARRAFTLIELLVVMTVMGILIGLLLTALAGVRERARANQCQNRLSNIGKAVLGYEGDTGHRVDPGLGHWLVKGPKILIAEAVSELNQIDVCSADLDDAAKPTPLIARHNGILNVVLVDGSVQRYEIEDIDPKDTSLRNKLWIPERLGTQFCQ